MKTIIQLRSLVVMIAMLAVLSSFAPPMGAHSFQILLDDKQLADQYAKLSMTMPKVVVDPAENHKQLIVKYSECGRTVSGRVITAKDVEDKVVKEWRFEGTTSGFNDPMSISVKDLVALKKSTANTVKLFYASKDFPEGQQIATVVIGGVNTASK